MPHVMDFISLECLTIGFDLSYISYRPQMSRCHGQDVCGSRLKVMLADPQDKSSTGGDVGGRKRAKFET